MLDIVSSILYHLLFWRLHHVVSRISYFHWQLLITVIAVGYLFWTAAKSTSARDKPRSRPLFSPRSANADVKSVPAIKSTRPMLQSRTIPNIRRQSQDRITPVSHKSASSSRECLSDRNRKSTMNETSTKFIKSSIKNFNNRSNKSFKPQLEDIKSSFLLLSKKNVKNDTNFKPESNVTNKTSKPQPLNEKQRREKLMEAMKKYKTKEYFNDSKYDQIEGLNWVSWK